MSLSLKYALYDHFLFCCDEVGMKRRVHRRLRVFARDVADLFPDGERAVTDVLEQWSKNAEKRARKLSSPAPNTASSIDEHHHGLLMDSTLAGSCPKWPPSSIEVGGSAYNPNKEKENTMQSLNSVLIESREGPPEVPLLHLEEAHTALESCLHVYRGDLAMPTTDTASPGIPTTSFAEAVARTHREVINSRSKSDKAYGLYAHLPESATHPLQSVKSKQICGLGSPFV